MRKVMSLMLFLCLMAVVGNRAAFAQTTWSHAYGGAGQEEAHNIQQTSDGGYIVVGRTDSFGAGDRDIWVLKLDAGGNVTWQRTYGGAGFDQSLSIQQTGDGGYIVAGVTGSFGAGWFDVWVLKLDAGGNVTWQRTYGGAGDDVAWSIQQTTDGGYIVAGYTDSFGAGSFDVWVLKLDAGGNVTWQRRYGGGGGDEASSIQQTGDGGYIVAGYTHSFGAGLDDLWVLKLDAGGNVTWQKTYGGADFDQIPSIQQTADEGYIVAGWTESFGAGGRDFWVLKLDGGGNVTWQKTYGGAGGGGGGDAVRSIQQTGDGGYIVAGTTDSFGAGFVDVWVLKLDAGGNVTWQRTYGGAAFDGAIPIQQTADGGYIVAGVTDSFGAFFADLWVLKLDGNGGMDASCNFISDTTVSPIDSFATVTDTSVIGPSTSAAITDTGVTGVPSSGTDTLLCSSPLNNPPEAEAGFIPIDVEEDEGHFEIAAAAADPDDNLGSIVSVIALPSLDGLDIELDVEDEVKIEFNLEEGKVEVKGPDPEALLAEIEANGGLLVVHGQYVWIEITDEAKYELKYEEGVLHIEAPEVTLSVTATDTEGLTDTDTASPVFTPEDENENENEN